MTKTIVHKEVHLIMVLVSRLKLREDSMYSAKKIT